MAHRFIGIDLTDPYARKPRSITVVEFSPTGEHLAGNLNVRGNITWPTTWPDRATSLSKDTPLPQPWPIPNKAETLWLALDGPQGLAGQTGDSMRVCEQEAGAPGHTSYDYPIGIPFANYIVGSIVLWSQLTWFLWPQARVDGDPAARTPAQVNLCEVFPGVTWRDVSRIGCLPPKGTREGKEARVALLRALGINAPANVVQRRDADDVLDAGIGAVVAYCWKLEIDCKYGKAPQRDPNTRTWREGYIRPLRWQELPEGNRLDLGEVKEWIRRFQDRRRNEIEEVKREQAEAGKPVPRAAGPIRDLRALDKDRGLNDVLFLYLHDNGGVWEKHNPWLIELKPSVVVQVVADPPLTSTLTPARQKGMWKAQPTTLEIARAHGFRGAYLSRKDCLLIGVRVLGTGI